MAIGTTNAMTIVGGTPSQGTLEVKYWDIDGTLLKTQFINPGENATPPANPQYDSELIFTEWNQSSVGLTYPADIGATYSCVNTIIYLMINDNSGYQPTIVMNKLDTSLVTVEWGDGTTSTSSASGDITLLKATPYASVGTYKIRIVSAVDTIRNKSNTPFFNNTIYDKWVTKIFFGNNIQSFQNGMITQGAHYRLEVIALNTNKTPANHPINSIQAFQSLKALIALNKVYDGTTFYQNNCNGIIVVSLPNNGSTINNVFNSSRNIRRAIFPPLNTYGTGANCSTCTGLEYVYYIGGTTLVSQAFNQTPSLKKVDNFDFTTITSIGGNAMTSTALPLDLLDLSNCTDVPLTFAVGASQIKKIIFPTTMTTTALPNFYYRTTNVEEVIYPESTTSMGTFSVNGFPLATKIDCQFTATFGTSSFTGLNSLKTLIFRNTNPPANMFAASLTLNTFTNIYVPDAQVNDYKALTYLSTYAAQILPLSLLPA